jgi:hypothetical protein
MIDERDPPELEAVCIHTAQYMDRARRDMPAARVAVVLPTCAVCGCSVSESTHAHQSAGRRARKRCGTPIHVFEDRSRATLPFAYEGDILFATACPH